LAKSKVPIQFRLQVELGDGKAAPPTAFAAEVTALLAQVTAELQLK
jgi:hypothetical protein